MFRKVAPWYARRFGPASEFNKHVVRISTKAQFDEVWQGYLRWRGQFLDEHGALKPKFRPALLVASFMQDPAVAARQSIPVPKGPVCTNCEKMADGTKDGRSREKRTVGGGVK